ncbi:RNA 2'-phosphotransferase [Commensalibacter nepenthis]|uniref:Probable RNA 2'-phosphotransferase n=1 Tax=Commensalibacter nepenthis TaxID=3043872 RepID=A0ABT6QAH4_9PROT|nr:RNA 2'-phosphotransferase [Commensalibacter sp. TBRC 10068]MDI2113907.1 RNA 2'-phosphotransferase [Commensalibacter sp. TBRC 10068]
MSKEISKMLSLVLRHAPEHIGIILDQNGWTDIKQLISKAKKAGYKLSLDDLLETVQTNDKQRFTISEDGQKIRAAQGHSIDIDLALQSIEPPDVLFHGTASANLNSIFEQGIHSAKRQYVHLSSNEETALKVGNRHGKAIVLKINTGQMFKEGFKFFKADNGVWLTDHILPKYIAF